MKFEGEDDADCLLAASTQLTDPGPVPLLWPLCLRWLVARSNQQQVSACIHSLPDVIPHPELITSRICPVLLLFDGLDEIVDEADDQSSDASAKIALNEFFLLFNFDDMPAARQHSAVHASKTVHRRR